VRVYVNEGVEVTLMRMRGNKDVDVTIGSVSAE
jgi:hypothetical protein